MLWRDDEDNGERGGMYGNSNGSEEDKYQGTGRSSSLRRKAPRKSGEEKGEEDSYRTDFRRGAR